MSHQKVARLTTVQPSPFTPDRAIEIIEEHFEDHLFTVTAMGPLMNIVEAAPIFDVNEVRAMGVAILNLRDAYYMMKGLLADEIGNAVK